jgi:hypothetical protein
MRDNVIFIISGNLEGRNGRRKSMTEHFTVSVKVSVSPMFLGWIMALDGVKILAPDAVVEKMKERILKLYEVYVRR